MTCAALRGILSDLWAVAGFRYLVIGGAVLAAAGAIWRGCLADRATTAGARAAGTAAVAHSSAEGRRVNAQARADIAATQNQATAKTIRCKGVLTWTVSGDGTKIWRCEGEAVVDEESHPEYAPRIPAVTDSAATAGMGAIAAAGAVRSRFSLMGGIGIRLEDLPAIRFRYLTAWEPGFRIPIVQLAPGLAVTAMPWTPYLTFRLAR